MASSPTERDPLIRKLHVQATPQDVQGVVQHRLGPLEISARNRRGTLTGIWLSSFLGALTLVPTMMPSISSEFQQFNQAAWLGTGYLLATCTFTPLYGRLCNAMGCRGASQTAIVSAAVGTIGCGLARNTESLIFACFGRRILHDFDVGYHFLTDFRAPYLDCEAPRIIASDMYTLHDRSLVQGLATCFNGLSMSLGGPFGGISTDRLRWHAAFLQLPLYAISLFLASYNIRYVTLGKSKTALEVLKCIDYFGNLTLLVTFTSLLVFLSTRYNEGLPWSDVRVIMPLVFSIVFFKCFLGVELFVAPEPVMAPFMLRQKIPVLVSASNFLVAACIVSVTYFFPMWFQVVALQSASTACLHLMLNSVSLSTGVVFAGWLMHRTGHYKTLNLILGIVFPFVKAVLISLMKEDSGTVQSCSALSPLGLGNTIVLQTMLTALLAHLPESQMAVGTRFGQLFRGIGQVGGVAISSAILQSCLDTELRKRIHTPDAEECIRPVEQRPACDAYAIRLKTGYIFAACSMFLAYCVHLPNRALRVESRPTSAVTDSSSSSTSEAASVAETETEHEEDEAATPARPGAAWKHRRWLSTYESTDGFMDLEGDRIEGSARVVPRTERDT